MLNINCINVTTREFYILHSVVMVCVKDRQTHQKDNLNGQKLCGKKLVL